MKLLYVNAPNESVCFPARLAGIRLLAMDVDGVLTDGTLGLDSAGGEQKRFHVADGLGLTALRQEGVTVAWLSGRANPIVAQRGRELGVAFVVQGVRDKGAALERLTQELGLSRDQVAYIGDDWNDLLAFDVAGLRIAVANAADEVKRAADVVTARPGGAGAVREVCEAWLDAGGLRDAALKHYLDALRAPSDPGHGGQ